MIWRLSERFALAAVLWSIGFIGTTEGAFLRFGFEALDDNEELISGHVLFPFSDPNATGVDGPVRWEIYFERWDSTWVSGPTARGFLEMRGKQPYDLDASPPWFQEHFGVLLIDGPDFLDIGVAHFWPDFPDCGMFGDRIADLLNYPINSGGNFGVGYCGEGDPFWLAYQWDGRFNSLQHQNLSLEALSFQIVPEPSLILLTMMAAVGFYAARRRRS
jgi:hypothetical protein